MKVFVVGVMDVNGVDVAHVFTSPDVPGLPPKYMICPEPCDAGHVAAAAQYLSLGQDAVVWVSNKAHKLFKFPDKVPEENEDFAFADDAFKRGVKCYMTYDGNVMCANPNGTCTIIIKFQKWSKDHPWNLTPEHLLQSAEAEEEQHD
jgi:hypothetical protein